MKGGADVSRSLYELIALGARYVFAALMVLVVLRAWRITLVDSRRAATLRRMSPQTGLSGELVVMQGDGKARRGMRYPVIREGMIGTSRRADIRIRHASVRRRHAYFQLTDDGLRVSAHAGAPLKDGRGRPAREITLPDGGEIVIGQVRLLLVLSEAPEPAKHRRPDRRDRDARDVPPADDLFDTDRMFRENPVLRHEPAPQRAPERRPEPERRLGRPIDVDEYFDIDDDDQW